MSDNFWTAFFANLPALVASLIALVSAIAAFVQSLRNGEKAAVLAEKIEVVHRATNSIKDELVASTARAAHAEGLAEGTARERERSEGEEGGRANK